MKINNVKIHNNPSFGLKIVKNNTLNKIVEFRLNNGESKENILFSFNEIKKLHDDNISLTFTDYEEGYDDIFLGPFILCNLNFSGKIKDPNTNIEYKINSKSKDKYVINLPFYLVLTEEINDLIK